MSWNQLLSILNAAQEEARDNAAQEPIACPVHGDPLEKARGVLHCPMGHIVEEGS